MTTSALSAGGMPVGWTGGRAERWLRPVFLITLFIFILATLFDPADRLFGMKVPLYLASWVIGAALSLAQPFRVRLPTGLLSYAVLMVTIPLFSIWVFHLRGGAAPFQGFTMMNAYVFISMAVLLYVTRVDLIPVLSLALTILAIAVILLFVVVLIEPALYLPLYIIGDDTGMFSVSRRDYGGGVVMFQAFFHTSPMIAIAAAHYFYGAWNAREKRGRFVVLTVMCLVSLFLAGGRNNMMVAIAVPTALWLLLARNKVGPLGLSVLLIGSGALVLADAIAALLDPTEISNAIKLRLLGDYWRILSDPVTLLVGRGLGAYEHWTDRTFYYVTELTYLEIFRNFGLPLGLLMIGLLTYPILDAFVLRPWTRQKHIVVGFAFYLLMGATNPLVFSSMGMLILGALLANIYLEGARPVATAVTPVTATRA